MRISIIVKKRDSDPRQKENRDPGSAKFIDAKKQHRHLPLFIKKGSIPDYLIMALLVVSVVDPRFFIPDPIFFSIPDPGSEFFPSRIKEFKYFNPKNCNLSSRKYDSGCSSRIRILIFYPSRIPDQGVEKGTGSWIHNTGCGESLTF
jgi:hypothetical protein